MHANYFRVGGVHQDLPPKLLDDIWAFCDPFLNACVDNRVSVGVHGSRKFDARTHSINTHAWSHTCATSSRRLP
jgi:NADH:ubiquinone oxidoreductase subunit D